MLNRIECRARAACSSLADSSLPSLPRLASVVAPRPSAHDHTSPRPAQLPAPASGSPPIRPYGFTQPPIPAPCPQRARERSFSCRRRLSALSTSSTPTHRLPAHRPPSTPCRAGFCAARASPSVASVASASSYSAARSTKGRAFDRPLCGDRRPPPALGERRESDVRGPSALDSDVRH